MEKEIKKPKKQLPIGVLLIIVAILGSSPIWLIFVTGRSLELFGNRDVFLYSILFAVTSAFVIGIIVTKRVWKSNKNLLIKILLTLVVLFFLYLGCVYATLFRIGWEKL